MKKTGLRQPIEPQNAPQYGFNKQRPLKIPKFAWYALLLSFVLAAALFVVYGISFKGVKDADKTLLIYSDGTKIPEVSLRNSLAAADFEYQIIEPDEKRGEPGFVYELPHGYGKGEVVVCAIGEDAFKVMDDLVSDGPQNIEGFILIEPEYPGNASLAKYTSDFPSVPCAVFGFDNQAKSSTELTGAQMIFEKISGVDTMYGHSTTRGKLFPSKIFVSPNQMRYLSLSTKKTGKAGLISSISFQNELSQYLGTTFENGYSSARISVRQIVLVLSIFLSVAALSVFLFMVPVQVREKARRELKGRDSLGAIIFLGLSGWLALCGIVMTIIPQTKEYTKYVALYSPVVLIALMAIAQIRMIGTNKFSYKRKDFGLAILLASVFTGIIELMIIFGTALNLTNVEKSFSDSTDWIAVLVVFVVMSLSAVALIFSDKKSRAAGYGATAFFASPAYFIEALVPSLALLILSAIQGNEELVTASIGGLGIAVLPLVCALPIKRISDYYEITGLIFGIVAGVVLFVAM